MRGWSEFGGWGGFGSVGRGWICDLRMGRVSRSNEGHLRSVIVGLAACPRAAVFRRAATLDW